MKRHLRDGWVQVFVAIAAFSGIIGVFGGRTRSERESPPPAIAATPAPTAAPTPAAASVPATAPIAAPVLASPALVLPAAQPAAVAMPPAPPVPPFQKDPEPDPPPKMTMTGPGVVPYAPGAVPAPGPANPMLGIVQSLSSIAQNTMLMATRQHSYSHVTPKKPGHFSVGPPGDPVADTNSIADAVYSARNGDTIFVQPGTYDGSFAVTRRKISIIGMGSRPQDVVIRTQDAGPAIMALDSADVTLTNLSVTRMGNGQYPTTKRAALYASGSGIYTSRVELRSREYMGVAVMLEEGAAGSRFALVSSTLDGDYADLVMRGRGRGVAMQVTFLHEEQPVVLWRDALAAISKSDFRLSPNGALYAYEGSLIGFASMPKPLVRGVREDARLTDDANLFSDSSRGQATSWKRSIFRAGRKPGSKL